MSLLTTVLDDATESLVVVQTSLATPWLPFFHALLAPCSGAVVCVCILHAPEDILPASLKFDKARAKVVDWTASVPNYEYNSFDGTKDKLNEAVLDAIASTPPGPVTLVVDSPDTLHDDLHSISTAYSFLKTWHGVLESRPAPSRMILPLPARSPLLPRLIAPSFAPALVHLTLHAPILLHHLATAHLAPAPPHARFWALFASARTGVQAEQLVWAEGGTGWVDAETVVEVLVRRARGRRVERTIEGWRPAGPCELTELNALRGIWSARPKDMTGVQAVDPARDLSFNLVLTDAQQHARAQVPLPYAHAGAGDGTRKDVVPPPPPSTILYDPDSADDLDDDDPDEDLDI